MSELSNLQMFVAEKDEDQVLYYPIVDFMIDDDKLMLIEGIFSTETPGRVQIELTSDEILEYINNTQEYSSDDYYVFDECERPLKDCEVADIGYGEFLILKF